MFSQKMTISFLLDLNLNVTWTNIKLPNIVRCKQNVMKGTAANAAAVSCIVQGPGLSFGHPGDEFPLWWFWPASAAE